MNCLLKWALVGLAGGTVVCAQPAAGENPPAREPIQVTATQTLDFPSGGTLRLTNATGVVTISGWDQPRVEITTIKSSKDLVQAKDRPQITRILDAVKVTAEPKGEEVVVASTYPKHSRIERPFVGLTDFNLEYRIRVPRAAKLVIQQNMGETNLIGVTGEIQVRGGMGQINVQLPDGQYAVDARTKLGSVYSDFPGTGQTRRWVGHAFVAESASPAQKLELRLGYGDILIQKAH